MVVDGNMNNKENSFLLTTLEIDYDDKITENQLLTVIQERVIDLLDQDPALLFSYMYRLDVLESKIQFALKHQKHIPTDEALAKLILERHLQRVAIKKKYKQEPLDGWEF